MSHSYVPPVTFEDLQAFQAKHFPTSIKPLQPPPTQVRQTYEDTHDASNDEDLGYYPDGVKRTLTDEQIRIFRHSEIHALLRERQIREENEDFERRMGDKASSGARAGETENEGEGEQENLEKNNGLDIASTDQSAGQGKQNTSVGAGTKRSAGETESDSSEPVAKRPSTSIAAGDVYLGYNESAAQRPSRVQAASSQFTGRRIISYED
ncbi:hypothetical protein BDW62DRAFT_102939 [Aspergillus aurantiobrunneus]